jgi:hypothetical protein
MILNPKLEAELSQRFGIEGLEYSGRAKLEAELSQRFRIEGLEYSGRVKLEAELSQRFECQKPLNPQPQYLNTQPIHRIVHNR